MLPYENIQQAASALGKELTFMERLWFNYSSKKPDYLLHSHILLSMCFLYSVIPLSYVFVELCWSNKANKYKVQPNSINSFSDMFKCYKDVITLLLIVVLPLQIVNSPLFEWAGIRTSLPLPSKWEIVCQITVYLLIEDYLGYWLHRLLHSKWFYDKIHRIHHEYSSPMGFAAPYAHWGEVLILGIPAFLGPVLVPCHIATLWLWFLTRLSETIELHSGYDFPWSVTKYIPFYVGVEYHDYHHYVGGNTSSNFAPVFTFCDDIYGTNKGYKFRKSALKKFLEESMEKKN